MALEMKEAEIKRMIELIKRREEMKLAIRIARKNAGEGLHGQRGDKSSEDLFREFKLRGDRKIPNEVIKKRGKLTEKDLRKGVYLTKAEIERFERIDNIESLINNMVHGKERKAWNMERLLTSIINNEENMFKASKAKISYDAVDRVSIKKDLILILLIGCLEWEKKLD